MTRLRFSQAQQVLDAVPELSREMTLPAGTNEPLTYLGDLLANGKPSEAIAFCSFLLPRREAVQWLCATVRNVGAVSVGDEPALSAAENWVKTPTETARKAASQAAEAGDKGHAGTWAAYAAAWSGGNMTNDDEHPVPPPAHLTGVAVKVGHNLAALTVSEAERSKLLEGAIKGALAVIKQE